MLLHQDPEQRMITGLLVSGTQREAEPLVSLRKRFVVYREKVDLVMSSVPENDCANVHGGRTEASGFGSAKRYRVLPVGFKPSP